MAPTVDGPEHPYLVAEMETGYAVVGDHQIYRGYTLFVAKRCVRELHELPSDERLRFLEEMSIVAEAVCRAFRPRKLNYELLGNSVAHLHWHLFPRYDDDPDPAWPVWERLRTALEKPRPVEPALIADLRGQLRAELGNLR
jgi:diadenosine tetraphosphate (Ap4A) HIT family hydrolase